MLCHNLWGSPPRPVWESGPRPGAWDPYLFCTRNLPMKVAQFVLLVQWELLQSPVKILATGESMFAGYYAKGRESHRFVNVHVWEPLGTILPPGWILKVCTWSAGFKGRDLDGCRRLLPSNARRKTAFLSAFLTHQLQVCLQKKLLTSSQTWLLTPKPKSSPWPTL